MREKRGIRIVSVVLLVIALCAALAWGVQQSDSPATAPSANDDSEVLAAAGLEGKIYEASVPKTFSAHIPVVELRLEGLEEMVGRVTPSYLPPGYRVQRVFIMSSETTVAILLLISDEPMSDEKVTNIEELYTGVAEMGLIWREGQAKILARLILDGSSATEIGDMTSASWIDLGNGLTAYLSGDESVVDVYRLNGGSVCYQGVPPHYVMGWSAVGYSGVVQAYKGAASREAMAQIAGSIPVLDQEGVSAVRRFVQQEWQRSEGL